MPEIELIDVSVYYGSRKNPIAALEHFNARFIDGKINVIVGENGCGKTTLLKCLTQSINYLGKITFDGQDISELSIKSINFGYVGPELSLFPTMTVFENIAFPLMQRKVPALEVRARVREMANKLGIAFLLNRRPKELSLGQQQLVGIARALVKRPSICLFDEPFTHVDRQKADRLCRMLKKIKMDFSTTFIFVTHDFHEAVALGDYIHVMNRSAIEVKGTPHELMHSTNETVRYLIESVKLKTNK
ncbi:MAG: ABC transporter ATP-binding protein [Bacilli bacterium]